jgi:adenylate cyclase
MLSDQIVEGIHGHAVNSPVIDRPGRPSLPRQKTALIQQKADPNGMARFLPPADGMRSSTLAIQDAFDKFAGSEIRDAVLRQTLPQHGRLHDVTILFADLRNFTGWVESTPPEEVAEDLSEYLAEMGNAIARHEGLILQFIGDEIEAVFGAPAGCSVHADRAVAAAIEMRSRLEALNARRARDSKRPLRHGIGVHTGTVLARVVGSASHLFYALIGDAVIVASRIQELNKTVASDILVSASTRERLSRGHDFVDLGAMMLRGRAAAVTVYQLR